MSERMLAPPPVLKRLALPVVVKLWCLILRLQLVLPIVLAGIVQVVQPGQLVQQYTLSLPIVVISISESKVIPPPALKPPAQPKVVSLWCLIFLLALTRCT